MTGRRRAQLLVVLAVASTAAAAVYESFRERPPEADPVSSPLPVHEDETERIEGGFEWIATRDGRKLFELVAGSLWGIEGGVHFLRDVDRLRLFLEDGRAVDLRSRAGKLEQRAGPGSEPVVVLEGDVLVSDPDRLTLRTDKLVYDAASREMRSPARAEASGEDFRAVLGSFTYRPDGRVLEAHDMLELDLGGGLPLRLEAAKAHYRLTTGELVFDAPFRVRRPDETLIAGPATFSVRRAEASEEPLRAAGPVLLLHTTGDRVAQLAAGSIEFGRTTSEAGPVERIVAGPPASLAFRSDGSRPELWTVLETSRIVVTAGEHEAGSTVSAGPGFRVRWPGAQEPWELLGERLTASRVEPERPAQVHGVGGVVLRGPDSVSAEADEAHWNAATPERLELKGAPARARQGSDLVEAPQLIVLRRPDILIGEQGAVTEVYSLEGRQDTLFRAADDGEPARVRSERVVLPREREPLEFEGQVQAWQGTTSLRCQRMRVERERERLIAEQDVNLRLEIEDASGEPQTARLLADRLDYASSTRTVVLSGDARYEETSGSRVSAAVLAIQLDAEGDVERLEATGAVDLAMGDARGSADRMTWEGGSLGRILLIGDQRLAELETAEQGILKTRRVRYDLATRRAEADSGPGRGRIESTPSQPSNEERQQ
ncbi:MAG: hypothetical protein JSV80_03085 [Acidobacteriota bacterium]|nr:MAG: hypothetical protein JSV80_03085 [Acidobacteriota bacterium]